MAKISTFHSNDENLITKDNPLFATFVEMTHRMFMGEDSEVIFKEYCTEDFWWKDPESHLFSPKTEGRIYGLLGVDYRSKFYRNDGLSFRNIGYDTLWSNETEDTLFRKTIWWASDPHGEYSGFQDGERVDQKIVMELYDFVKFRDGKVASVETMGDMLGFNYDMAGWDFKKALMSYLDNADWWMEQRKNIESGLPCMEDPGKPFCD